jgi:hypothetical protein
VNGDAFCVRHMHLDVVDVDTDKGDTPSLSIFWWKDLPLGIQTSLPDELPYAEARLRQPGAMSWRGVWPPMRAKAAWERLTLTQFLLRFGWRKQRMLIAEGRT